VGLLLTEILVRGYSEWLCVPLMCLLLLLAWRCCLPSVAATCLALQLLLLLLVGVAAVVVAAS